MKCMGFGCVPEDFGEQKECARELVKGQHHDLRVQEIVMSGEARL